MKKIEHKMYIRKSCAVIKTISLSMVFLIGLTGCEKKEERREAEAMKIDVAEAKMDSVVIYKDYPGTLRSVNVVPVVGRVNGLLRSHDCESGSIVKKGQLLFTIEDTQYLNAVKQAEAQLETAMSTNEYNKSQYGAMKAAYERNAVSKMELIQAESNFKESEASIKDAEAELSTARTNLSYCRVTAPIGGMITASTMSVGSYVGGEGDPVTLATIYDNTSFYADFYIDDATYMAIVMGNKYAGIEMDSVPVKFTEPYEHSYIGRLTYAGPNVDTGTGTLLLRVELNNFHEELRDGMYAMISLPSATDSRAVLVKDASIGTDQLGKYLFVVNNSNEVEYRSIKTGSLVNDSMRVVTSGLEAGERYVTRALLKVRNGEKIDPILKD